MNKLFLVYKPASRYFPAYWCVMYGGGIFGIRICGQFVSDSQVKPARNQMRKIMKKWKKEQQSFLKHWYEILNKPTGE